MTDKYSTAQPNTINSDAGVANEALGIIVDAIIVFTKKRKMRLIDSLINMASRAPSTDDGYTLSGGVVISLKRVDFLSPVDDARSSTQMSADDLEVAHDKSLEFEIVMREGRMLLEHAEPRTNTCRFSMNCDSWELFVMNTVDPRHDILRLFEKLGEFGFAPGKKMTQKILNGTGLNIEGVTMEALSSGTFSAGEIRAATRMFDTVITAGGVAYPDMAYGDGVTRTVPIILGLDCTFNSAHSENYLALLRRSGRYGDPYYPHDELLRISVVNTPEGYRFKYEPYGMCVLSKLFGGYKTYAELEALTTNRLGENFSAVVAAFNDELQFTYFIGILTAACDSGRKGYIEGVYSLNRDAINDAIEHMNSDITIPRVYKIAVARALYKE